MHNLNLISMVWNSNFFSLDYLYRLWLTVVFGVALIFSKHFLLAGHTVSESRVRPSIHCSNWVFPVRPKSV